MAEQRADVVVVGAGPAGLAAASCAAERGKRVIVLDDSPRPGGQIWRHRSQDSLPAVARTWLTRFERSGATLWSGATVVDLVAGAVQGEREGRPFSINTAAIILCVGARELFLPFPGWTLPGVVGVGGGQALLKAGTNVRGQRVVIAGSGPLILPVAAAMAKAGAKVVSICEQAPFSRLASFALTLWRSPAKVLEAMRYRAAFAGTRFHTGRWIVRANGDDRVRDAVLTDGSREYTIPCDVLCAGFGLVPATELPRLAECALDDDGNVRVDELQQTTQPGIYCAGETTGLGGVDAALVEGQIAGYAAAAATHLARPLFAERDRQKQFAQQLKHSFALRDELRSLATADTIVCRCEDVRFAQLEPCGSLREAKLYTRAGMGPCQGRVCGAALHYQFGWSADTVRVPAAAASVGVLADHV